MGYHLDAAPGQASKLIEIAEAIEKRRAPWVAAAGCVRGFGEPERLAGSESIAETGVEFLHPAGARQPLFGERLFRGGSRFWNHARTPFGNGSIEMVGEGIEGRTRGGEQILGLELAPRHTRRHQRDSLADGAGTQNHHIGSSLPGEGAEDGDIARISRGIIALRCATYLRKGGLVHVFGCGDAAADGFGISQEPARLCWSPDAGGIAGPRAGGKGSDDAGAGRAREVHHTLPLAAGQHSIEARGRI